MEEQKNNIRVLLSDKAELILGEILKNFGLEDKNVIVDRIIKNFARENLSENSLVNSLQKDLEVTQQMATDVAKELISKVMPLLEKYPEEKFSDPVFREQVSEKLFGPEKKENKTKPEDIFSKIKTPIGVENALQKKQSNPPEAKTIESPQDEKIVAPAPKRKSRLPRKPATKTTKESVSEQPKKQNSGPDKYREPIG